MISSSTSGSNSKEFSVKNHDRLSHPLSFGKEHLCLSQDVKTFSENTYSSLCSTDQHTGGTCDRYPARSGTGLERISAVMQIEKQAMSRIFATRSEPSSYGHSRFRSCSSTRIRENRRQRSISRGDPTAYVTHVEES